MLFSSGMYRRASPSLQHARYMTYLQAKYIVFQNIDIFASFLAKFQHVFHIIHLSVDKQYQHLA